jgi:hypothetical protein
VVDKSIDDQDDPEYGQHLLGGSDGNDGDDDDDDDEERDVYRVLLYEDADSVGHIKASIHQQSEGEIPICSMRLLYLGDELIYDCDSIGDLAIPSDSLLELQVVESPPYSPSHSPSPPNSPTLPSAAELLSSLVPVSEITVGEAIGSGPLGVVLEATWRSGKIAIKKLDILDAHPNTAAWSADDKRQVAQKLVRECYSSTRIHHPNIVQFLGIAIDNFESRRPQMLMMELMRGGSLSKLLYASSDANGVLQHRRELPVSRQLQILLDVCSALEYLHTRKPPILHLDIKPDSILLDGGSSSARAKISDLGQLHVAQCIARQAADAGRTVLPFGAGGPLYSAPEMKHDNERKSGRTDMFSFGVLMCELSSGRRPNPGPEHIRVSRLSYQEVPEEKRRADDVAAMKHDAMRSIVQHLIVHEMEERWHATQVLQALTLLQQSEHEQASQQANRSGRAEGNAEA